MRRRASAHHPRENFVQSFSLPLQRMCQAAHRFDGGAKLVCILNVHLLRYWLQWSPAWPIREQRPVDFLYFHQFANVRQDDLWISSVEAKGRETQHSVPELNACTQSRQCVSGESKQKKGESNPNERTRTNIEYLNFFNGF